jgi:hypothetical protein
MMSADGVMSTPMLATLSFTIISWRDKPPIERCVFHTKALRFRPWAALRVAAAGQPVRPHQ